jgi:hypothetical protein
MSRIILLLYMAIALNTPAFAHNFEKSDKYGKSDSSGYGKSKSGSHDKPGKTNKPKILYTVVSGVVLSSYREPVSGVEVRFHLPTGETAFTATTQPDGSYSSHLPVGSYLIEVVGLSGASHYAGKLPDKADRYVIKSNSYIDFVLDDSKPIITKMAFKSPKNKPVEMIVTGSGFGSTPGLIDINGKLLDPKSVLLWSDTSIRFIAPVDTPAGCLYVFSKTSGSTDCAPYNPSFPVSVNTVPVVVSPTPSCSSVVATAPTTSTTIPDLTSTTPPNPVPVPAPAPAPDNTTSGTVTPGLNGTAQIIPHDATSTSAAFLSVNITDPDGIDSSTLVYQWLNVMGGSQVGFGDATPSGVLTLEPSFAMIQLYPMSVLVTYKDLAGNSERVIADVFSAFPKLTYTAH